MLVRIFGKLSPGEGVRLRILSKPRKQESKGRVVEETDLSASTVLVHGFSHNGKVHDWVLQVFVVLVVPV